MIHKTELYVLHLKSLLFLKAARYLMLSSLQFYQYDSKTTNDHQLEHQGFCHQIYYLEFHHYVNVISSVVMYNRFCLVVISIIFVLAVFKTIPLFLHHSCKLLSPVCSLVLIPYTDWAFSWRVVSSAYR